MRNRFTPRVVLHEQRYDRLCLLPGAFRVLKDRSDVERPFCFPCRNSRVIECWAVGVKVDGLWKTKIGIIFYESWCHVEDGHGCLMLWGFFQRFRGVYELNEQKMMDKGGIHKRESPGFSRPTTNLSLCLICTAGCYIPLNMIRYLSLSGWVTSPYGRPVFVACSSANEIMVWFQIMDEQSICSRPTWCRTRPVCDRCHQSCVEPCLAKGSRWCCNLHSSGHNHKISFQYPHHRPKPTCLTQITRIFLYLLTETSTSEQCKKK